MTRPLDATSSPPAGDIPGLAEHFFRQESGKLVSVLTGIFGPERLQLAEDVVQDAFIRALQTWPYYGTPKNPSAWLMQVARNLALDILRREKNFREKEPEVIRSMDGSAAAPGETVFSDQELRDDRLRLVFVCCHPILPEEAQVALALKTLCGFGVEEIARAFLTSEDAVARRLSRAKLKIREARIPFEIPAGEELSGRLDAVLQTVYLLFNEGYKASTGDKLIREELCQEAIRLGTLLGEHPVGNLPRTHALLALMLLNAARLPARVDAAGHLLRLREQDRALWRQDMIARGMFHLARSAEGETMSRFHLEAGIAACHCTSASYESTDWPQILFLYDALINLDDSPVVALNRAVALAHVHGPSEAMKALAPLGKRPAMESYYLLHAVRGDLAVRLNDFSAAVVHFKKALSLADLKSEQDFLAARLHEAETASINDILPGNVEERR